MRQVNDRLEKGLSFFILPEVQKTIAYPNYTDEKMKAQRGKCLSQVTKSRKLQLQMLLLDTTLSQAIVIHIIPIIPISITLASVCIFKNENTQIQISHYKFTY